MKIRVKAKTKSKVERVERLDQPTLLPDTQMEMPSYKVSVKEAPIQGRANEAIIKALAVHLDLPSSAIKLISGQTSKQKIFDITLI